MDGFPTSTGKRVNVIREVEKLYSEVTEEFNKFISNIYSMNSMDDVDRIISEAERLKSRIQTLESKLPLLRDAVCRLYNEIERVRSDAKRLASTLTELYARLSSINTVCGGSSFARNPERCINDAEKLLEEAKRLHDAARNISRKYYAIDTSFLSQGAKLYNTIKSWTAKAELGVREVYKILIGSKLDVRINYSNEAVNVVKRLVTPITPSTDIGSAVRDRLSDVLWSYVLSKNTSLSMLIEKGLPGIDASSLESFIESVIEAKKWLDKIHDIAIGTSVEWRGRVVATITPSASFTRFYNKLVKEVEDNLAEMRIDYSSRTVTLTCSGSYDILNNNWVLEPRYKLNCRWCSINDVASKISEALSREVERLANSINSMATKLDNIISEYNLLLSEIQSVTGSGSVTIDAVAAAIAVGAIKHNNVGKLKALIKELKRELGSPGSYSSGTSNIKTMSSKSMLNTLAPISLEKVKVRKL